MYKKKVLAFHSMKKALLLLLSCCFGLLQAEPEVDVQLRSFRIEMKNHEDATAPELSLLLEFTSAEGLSVCETAKLPGKIKITDVLGKSQACEPSELKQAADSTRSAQAEISLPHRPKGDKIQIEGEVEVSVATEQTTHPRQAVDLLEPRSFLLAGAVWKAEPDQGNRDPKNIDGAKLRHAEVALHYPKDVDILRIDRVWNASTPDADSEAAGYVQELKFQTKPSPNGNGKISTLELWDAAPAEQLQITTGKELHKVKVPIRFTLSLGEISELTPAAPQP